jgi:hypothetical protein
LTLTVLRSCCFPYVQIHFSENLSGQALFDQERAGPCRRTGKKESAAMSFAIDRSRTIITAMIPSGRVTAQDVAWLRREVFSDGEVTRESANELFAVARAQMTNAQEWTELFVELITDYVVWQSRPTGVVSEEQAAWLIERADACKSLDALAALVNVLAEAHSAPQWFVSAVRARVAQWMDVEAVKLHPKAALASATATTNGPTPIGSRGRRTPSSASDGPILRAPARLA